MNKITCIRRLRTVALTIITGLSIFVFTTPSYAGFIAYDIRQTPTIINSAGSIEFIIDESSEKAGLGSNDINGATLGDITNLHIDRLDDRARFTTGSGPYVAPYLNFWITDGFGNFAVAANEPSNAAFQSLYNNGYDLSFADLSNKVVKIYENSDKSWLPDIGFGAGIDLTFADLASFKIAPPSVGDLTTGWSGLGTGAPRELGTNIAYGVNWVFGDTLSNYVSGDQGYVVANARVAATTSVPEPTTLLLLSLGLAGITTAQKRKKH